MSLYSRLAPKGSNGFGYGSTAEEVTAGLSLQGKTILLTGCSTGLGLETARVLALRGASVLGTARSMEKANQALGPFGPASKGFVCELSEPASVRACVDAIKSHGARLDAIVCNAGIMALPKLTQAHGLELQFLTNHMGHFLLVTGLLDQLQPDGRVVMVSSAAHRQAPRAGIELDNLSGARNYRSFVAYGQSKLANLLFAKELARRFQGSARTATALHPGVIATELTRHMPLPARVIWSMAGPLVLKNVAEGAATTCYAAVHPEAVQHSGRYLADCNPAPCSAHGEDAALAGALWDKSEALAATLNG